MAIILDDTFALPANMFSYHAGRFIAEASTLGFTTKRGECEEILRRIYDDACDVGVAIRGHHKVVRYYLDSVDKTPDGDIAGWRFKPISEDARTSLKVARTSVLIIND